MKSYEVNKSHPLGYLNLKSWRVSRAFVNTLNHATMTSMSLNVGNSITLKPRATNYPLRREQALALAENQDMLDHLSNEDLFPEKYTIPNPANTTNIEIFV
ncbi:hypothetical protein Lal_00033232 [Lupinus albus]|nr:hypothetical protein Lal_00033232 [Lupinus albus]